MQLQYKDDTKTVILPREWMAAAWPMAFDLVRRQNMAVNGRWTVIMVTVANLLCLLAFGNVPFVYGVLAGITSLGAAWLADNLLPRVMLCVSVALWGISMLAFFLGCYVGM